MILFAILGRPATKPRWAVFQSATREMRNDVCKDMHISLPVVWWYESCGLDVHGDHRVEQMCASDIETRDVTDKIYRREIGWPDQIQVT